MKSVPLLSDFFTNPFLFKFVKICTFSNVCRINEKRNSIRLSGSLLVICLLINLHGTTFVLISLCFTIVAEWPPFTHLDYLYLAK